MAVIEIIAFCSIHERQRYSSAAHTTFGAFCGVCTAYYVFLLHLYCKYKRLPSTSGNDLPILFGQTCSYDSASQISTSHTFCIAIIVLPHFIYLALIHFFVKVSEFIFTSSAINILIHQRDNLFLLIYCNMICSSNQNSIQQKSSETVDYELAIKRIER